MRSYIIRLADMKDAPFTRDYSLFCPEEFIDMQMSFLTYGCTNEDGSQKEPTDEDVVNFTKDQKDIEYVKTLEMYRTYLTENYMREQRKGAIDEAVKIIMNYVYEQSEWYFDDKELTTRARNAMKRTSEALKEEINKGIEDLSDEEFSLYYGDMTKEDLLAEYTEASRQEMAFAMWTAKEKGMLMTVVNMKDLAGQAFEIARDYAANNISFTYR